MKLRFERIWIIVLVGLLAFICRSEVKEIYVKREPVKGAPIAPPLFSLPPVGERPNPPTPEEIAAKRAAIQARADLQAALNKVLAQAGFTDLTDLAALSNATRKISAAQVTVTNQADADLRIIVKGPAQ